MAECNAILSIEANPNWPGNRIVSRGPDETRAIGQAWAGRWESPLCLALTGPLGAGKTELVRGFAGGLGCGDSVASPSFTLVNEYSGGRIPLFHLDFYRLGKAGEVLDLGFEELLDAGVVVVEWAERFPEVFPACASEVEIRILEETARELCWHPTWKPRNAAHPELGNEHPGH